jgi:L-arabinokinase
VDSRKKSAIAYYVTSHGYGHGVRSCGIIRAINELYPNLSIQIVTGLPVGFLDSQLGSHPNSIRSASFDIGMCQIDSIRVNVPSTLEKIRSLYSRRAEYVKREADYLNSHGIGMVVVDIPAIPIEAASSIGIPRVAVGNFSWDWIYSEFLNQDAGWQPIVDMFREEYAKTDLLLRLPFCDRMQAFPHVEDIPLIASPGISRRGEIVQMTQCDPNKKWILLSFTTLEWSEAALGRVERLTEYEFFTVDPLRWERSNIYPLDRRQMAFSDVLASMDAVLSKPGFGILSDCIANSKPLIYADRSNFLEYPNLVTAIEKYIKHVHIPTEKLYRGDLGDSLHTIWTSPEPLEEVPLGGDRIAADRIAQFL